MKCCFHSSAHSPAVLHTFAHQFFFLFSGSFSGLCPVLCSPQLGPEPLCITFLPLHTLPCRWSQLRTRAAVLQVWIDAVLEEPGARRVLDETQISSPGWGSTDQSECELCNNGDGRRWQWRWSRANPLPPLQPTQHSSCKTVRSSCESSFFLRTHNRL